MKVLIIPDIHQTTEFCKVVFDNIDKVDKVVILGDLVDCWTSKVDWFSEMNNPISTINMVHNLKYLYPKKIHWLLGNHDFAYISEMALDSIVSGHQFEHHKIIEDSFRTYLKDIEVAVKLDDWVFSHAGFSDKWVETFSNNFNPKKSKKFFSKLNKSILLKYGHLSPRGFSSTGDDENEGPLWIRPLSLLKKPYFRKQVVGHTEIGPLYLLREFNKDLNRLIILDNKKHDCYAILDTESDELSLLNGAQIPTHTISDEEFIQTFKLYNC